VALQGIREDIFTQFARLDDVEGQLGNLNSILNTIIVSFYQDINPNGVIPDNYAYFIQLIADLQANINSINAVSGGIINFLGIQQQLTPLAVHVSQLDDLDSLIQTKLDYIYGKWDVDPNDDILSV